jgi:hypothetical protein
MQKQLETYQIQINYLKEKIHLLQQFISSNRNQIDQMKKRLQTIQINK